MRKIIKEIAELDITTKEKEEFIRVFIARELGKNERARQILFNEIKNAARGKRLVFSKK